MHKPEIRARVKKRLKEIGHKPCIRGGNGKPSPEPVQRLLEYLSDYGFTKELVILTKARGQGYPPCYKVDLGNQELMLAIEIDGNSHCLLSRQAQDQKKERFLHSRGWTILRFSNTEVMNGISQCMAGIESTISKLKGHTHISQMVS
jgi:very-short-patch-repair endonuclease